MPSPSCPKFPLLWSALLVFFSVCYFENQYPLANVNSQFNMTRAIVERGTLAIDAYEQNTCDKAFYNGHFYCDKSPVNALLGVPVYALYYWLAVPAGGQVNEAQGRYVTTCAITGTSAAVLALLLTLALLRRGVAPVRAAAMGALWIVATPLFGYSILFYAYLPACVLLLGGYLLAEPEWQTSAPRVGRLLGAGLLVGLACWTLNTLAIPAVALTLPLVARVLRRRSGLAALGTWALGGVLGVTGHFIYNAMIFGHWLASPYHYEFEPLFRRQMMQGLMGATVPRLDVAWYITLHRFQGLFLWFPITVWALAGVVWGLRRASAADARRRRTESAVVLTAFALLLIYVSAYYMWWGGFAYAPRHLIPALPLLALGLTPWLRSHPGAITWRVLLDVAVLGAVLNAAAISVNPQPAPDIPDTLLMRPYLIAHWTSPFLKLQQDFWQKGLVDLNLGAHLGLAGRASLLPLAVVWVLAAVLLARWGRRETAPKALT
jgi:hypothetical protein